MASEDKPNVILFIKPSQVLKNADEPVPGSCPICQEWFLTLYCLSERNYMKVRVIVVTDIPPKEWEEVRETRPPVIHAKSGVAPNGEDLTDMTYTDLDTFLEVWQDKKFQTPKTSTDQSRAEKVFEDLYKNFNLMLTDGAGYVRHSKSVTRSLQKLNDYLDERGSKYLLGDDLSYADCLLIPKLHHLKIAGKAYRDYDIPSDLDAVWNYLKHVYETTAFNKSCPYDEDIVYHYAHKVSDKNLRKTFTRDLHKTLTVLERDDVNGDGD